MCHFEANTGRIQAVALAIAFATHGCLLRSGYEVLGDDARNSGAGRSAASSGGNGSINSGSPSATSGIGSTLRVSNAGNAGKTGIETWPGSGGITGGTTASGGSTNANPDEGGSVGATTGGTNATGGASGLSNLGGARASLGGASGLGSSAGNRSTGGVASASPSGGVAGATSSGGVAGASPSGSIAGATSNGGVAGATSSGGACSWSNGPPTFAGLRSVGLANTTQSEIDPVLSQDGLSLYFVRYTDAVTGNDIYVATRSSTTADFGKGTLFAQVSSTGNDTHFFVAANGLEGFVSSNRTGTLGGTAPDIFRSTRLTVSDIWSGFSVVSSVNSTGGDYDPHLESDGLTLWLAPIGRADGSGLQDLFYARRNDLAAPFGTPIAAASLNTTANEWNVSLSGDGRVIVFQSDRGAGPHVYYATRAGRSEAFGAPAEIASLNQYMATLSDPFISPDGCAIYFAATLATGVGGADMYVLYAIP